MYPGKGPAVAAIASAACTKFNRRLIGRTCDSLLIGTSRRRRRGRARSGRGDCGNSGRMSGGERERERLKRGRGEERREIGEETTRREEKKRGRKKQTRDSLEDESSRGTRFVLGSVNTSSAVFLVEESGWGIFRSRCG